MLLICSLTLTAFAYRSFLIIACSCPLCLRNFFIISLMHWSLFLTVFFLLFPCIRFFFCRLLWSGVSLLDQLYECLLWGLVMLVFCHGMHLNYQLSWNILIVAVSFLVYEICHGLQLVYEVSCLVHFLKAIYAIRS